MRKISHWHSKVVWLNAIVFPVVGYNLRFHLSNSDGLKRELHISMQISIQNLIAGLCKTFKIKL